MAGGDDRGALRGLRSSGADVSVNAVNALKDRGWMLATAESCTGGLIAGAVTDVAGSSTVFDRGFVTYSNRAKTQMLGVPPEVISTHGAVSEQVAEAMARGALARSDAQIAVSVTGIAGPGGSEHKPEGRVCFGLATSAGCHTETVDFGALGRAEVRARTVAHALALVEQAALS
nr:CinA family protein [Gymnodinialimonas phycosphaerae]